MTGYFTTEELYEKNRELALEFTKDYEIMELPKENLLKQSLTMVAGKTEQKENKFTGSSPNLPAIKEQKNEKQNEKKKSLKPDTKSYAAHSEEFKKQLDINLKNQIDIKLSTKSLKSLSISESVPIKEETSVAKNEIKEGKSGENDSSKKKLLNMEKKKGGTEIKIGKYQSTPYFGYTNEFNMIMYLTNPQENIKEINPNFGKELEEMFNEELEKHKRKLRILEMEKEIEFLTKKNDAIQELNKDLEIAIKHKKENLEKVTKQLIPNQISYTNKLAQLKNNLNGRGQYQLIYDSFVYQKMAEVCFVFFNKKIESLYSIPKFYNEPISISESKKMERLDYYNSDKKNISAMMGHICQLLIYLSKTFNIPLRFPIFLNGSKSYILRSVKDKVFLPLYFDAKKDDKHGNFDNALNCLKDDIKEIFNFLSMFPEIISKTDNENINNMNGKYLFFFFFVVFNHSLFRFMKTLQNAV